MSGECMGAARLTQEQTDKVHELEKELGTPVIAVDKTCQWSDLDEEKLQKLQDAEEELGVILLAYHRG